jgi:uncharacterized protein (TIGR03437 family)
MLRRLALALLSCTGCLPGAVTQPDLPLAFEANKGQFDASVKYLAHGKNHDLLLTSTGAVLVNGTGATQMRLAGARSSRIEATDQLPGLANYFIGSDRSRWRTHVPTYSRIVYRGVYPGIDQIYYGSRGELEYDFIVAPEARPDTIQLEFRGASRVQIEDSGDLVVTTAAGVFRHRKPVVYQVIGGDLRAVSGSYLRKGRNRVGFHVGSYDRSHPLVIDPVMQFSMFVGGAAFEQLYGATLDTAGNIYLTGVTTSPNFSLNAPHATGNTLGWANAFVVKLNPTASSVLYTTYFGGRYNEAGYSVAVDAAGNAYVAGTTNSDDLPVTPGAYQSKFLGGFLPNDIGVVGDGFVAKIDPSGDTLLYLTYLGGPNAEVVYDMAIDSAGNAYVVGSTKSVTFPITPDAAMRYGGDVDGFLAKLNSTGTALLYSTFIGGSGTDGVNRIVLDSAENIYLTGICSLIFPTTSGAYQKVNAGSGDAFVMKLNTAGKVVFSTLLGAQAIDNGEAIAVDAQGNVYVAGATSSVTFPVQAGAAPAVVPGPASLFVSKFDPTGATLLYTKILGGQKKMYNPAIAVAADGSLFLAAATDSSDIATTPDALQTKLKGAENLVVAKLNPAGTAFSFLSYLGGQGMEFPGRIMLDPAGNLIIAGTTSSGDFPVKGPLGQIYNGGTGDAFVTKLVFAPPLLALGSQTVSFAYTAGDAAPAPQSVTIRTDTVPAAVAVQSSGESWLSVDPVSGTTPATVKISVNPASLAPGSYSGSISITSRDAGNSPQKIAVTLVISSAPPPAAPIVSVSSVTNAASGIQGSVAPGEIITITGAGMGPNTPVAAPAGAPASTTLSDTRVFFDNQPAPLVSVSAKQIVAIAPFAIAPGAATTMTVAYQGVSSAPVTLAVATAAPGLYSADNSGKGQGLILNADGSPNSAENPAHPGDTVTLLGTGAGQTDPPGTDGSITADPAPAIALPVSVSFGGAPGVDAVSATALSGDVAGKFRIQVSIPDDAGTGDVPVLVTIGDAKSQPVLTLNIAPAAVAPGDAGPSAARPRR